MANMPKVFIRDILQMKFAAKLILFILLCCPVFEAGAVNIAVVAPKEGPMAKSGRELIEGAQIAVDIINEEGGIAGEKINLIAVDDRCEDSFAVSAAQMMALNSSPQDKINLVVGPYCNNSFAAISDIYSKAKIVRIVPLPLNASQYDASVAGLFKLSGLMSEEGKVFFDFYNRNFADKNVAVVYDSRMPETAETAFEVQQQFRTYKSANRITLFDFAGYGKDYTQMAKEILLNSQAAYVLGNAKQTAALVQKLQEQKENTVIFVDEYLATGYLFRELGNFAEGIYVLAMESQKDSPDFTEELVELRLKGKEPKGLGVYGYAAVSLWKQMAEAAGKFDFDRIVKHASGQSFMLPWGKVAFENGRPSLSGGHTVYQIKNGEYAQVY